MRFIDFPPTAKLQATTEMEAVFHIPAEAGFKLVCNPVFIPS